MEQNVEKVETKYLYVKNVCETVAPSNYCRPLDPPIPKNLKWTLPSNEPPLPPPPHTHTHKQPIPFLDDDGDEEEIIVKLGIC